MKNLINRKLKIFLVFTILMCFIGFTASAQTITSNSTGTNNGYWYTFWTDGIGSVSMTLGDGGYFSVTWSNCGNFVCGKGWSTGSESRTITYSGNPGGSQYYGVYGWMTNPLVEYYIPRSGGTTNRGTYQADGITYTLTTSMRINKPSILGDTTFEQYFAGGGSGGSINFGQHCTGWRSLGMSVGSQNYQVVAIEGWGGSSGTANATVGTSTTITPAPTIPPTVTNPPNTGGNITVRARGAVGGEQIEIRANNIVVGTFIMSTSYQDCNVSGSGTVRVYFTNDNGSDYDVQVDYANIDGSIQQAENQATNTAVYQNSSCGGSNSEWMHCNGYIEFGSSSTTTPEPTTPPTVTNPPSSGSTCSPSTAVAVPFTKDGAGELCWETTASINYINSWNVSSLIVNGVNFTNMWVSGSGLPAKIDGKYYIQYSASYSWSHFEIR